MKQIWRQGGFTLLELILVLLLIGIILGLSSFIVLGTTLPSARFSATARDLSATIREARSLARVSGDKQTVVINLDAGTYGIEGRKTRGIPGDTGILIRDPFAGDIRNGQYRIVVHASGAAEGGTIILRSGKKTASIQTDPIVGSVTIKP
jgi:prepilin-type N-terminal cleavage/methylation domain-containing protein